MARASRASYVRGHPDCQGSGDDHMNAECRIDNSDKFNSSHAGPQPMIQRSTSFAHTTRRIFVQRRNVIGPLQHCRALTPRLPPNASCNCPCVTGGDQESDVFFLLSGEAYQTFSNSTRSKSLGERILPRRSLYLPVEIMLLSLRLSRIRWVHCKVRRSFMTVGETFGRSDPHIITLLVTAADQCSKRATKTCFTRYAGSSTYKLALAFAYTTK